MTQIPFFIDIEFENKENPTPLTPVKTVELGYFSSTHELLKTKYDMYAEKAWNNVGEWLRQIKKFGWVIPCGWDLINLVWPALIFNLARHGESVPGFVMPLEKKWNNLDMIDLKSVVLQGGYSPDFEPDLYDVYSALKPDDETSYKGFNNLEQMSGIYLAYERIK